MHKPTTGSVLGAVLSVAGLFLLGNEAKAQFIYGTGSDGNIYEVNVATKTTSFLIPTGFTATPLSGDNRVNALANDRARNNLFFITPTNGLRVLRQGTGTTIVAATAADLGLTNPQTTPTNFPQNAAFFNGDYWFFSRIAATGITDAPVTLNRIRFNYTGNTPTFAERIAYSLTGIPNNTTGTGGINNNDFGDIAISSAGLLFAVTSNDASNNGRFFRLNLANLPANVAAASAQISGTYQTIPVAGTLIGDGYQIAFNSDDIILYGVETLGGNWVSINTTTGATTNLSPLFNTNPDFFDISDSATPVRIPGPLPLLGAAVAFGWGRKLRKRVKSSR